MEFLQQRTTNDAEQSFGFLRDFGNLFYCHTLEDEPREVKVKGETRIPAGRYELKIKKEETDLTLKHRIAYNEGYDVPWFKYHIEITHIVDKTGKVVFIGVYYHAGNDQKHTDGCPLLGNILDVTKAVKPLTNSIPCVKRFYDIVYPLLEKGERCFVTIKDEIDLFN